MAINQKTLALNWTKCALTANFCNFMTVDLEHENLNGIKGVYIIWYSNASLAEVVRVGQGVIKDRLADHRDNSEITAYSKQGTLYVTWAGTTENDRNGVEAYLGDRLKPLVGDRFPDAEFIKVNLPW